jgi:hypothetical protein
LNLIDSTGTGTFFKSLQIEVSLRKALSTEDTKNPEKCLLSLCVLSDYRLVGYVNVVLMESRCQKSDMI